MKVSEISIERYSTYHVTTRCPCECHGRPSYGAFLPSVCEYEITWPSNPQPSRTVLGCVQKTQRLLRSQKRNIDANIQPKYTNDEVKLNAGK